MIDRSIDRLINQSILMCFMNNHLYRGIHSFLTNSPTYFVFSGISLYDNESLDPQKVDRPGSGYISSECQVNLSLQGIKSSGRVPFPQPTVIPTPIPVSKLHSVHSHSCRIPAGKQESPPESDPEFLFPMQPSTGNLNLLTFSFRCRVGDVNDR